MNQKKTDAKPNPLEEKILALESELELAQNQANEAKASSLRALADLENYRRRLSGEQTKWSDQAVTQFLRKALPSFLELSLGASHSSDETMQQVVEKFFETMRAQGLNHITPKAGEVINPDFHEVLMVEEGTAGTVVHCLEIGWEYNGQVIQPAKVSGAQS
ncbi:nucleotide exchange factor GrpE [bacterium]|nr:nucleotide exchange factor GrpE [bacterium]NCQ54821.1 nucleotide exchange factor GrpE [Candidatus Parcubacteria bacterium]NCS66865.1 nucleotide exchange factor GrpE [Candidatus Peregrinibacteria bacterium]NCS95811.1 nucleotide exchange factor GrpE [bacterium]